MPFTRYDFMIEKNVTTIILMVIAGAYESLLLLVLALNDRKG